MCQCQTMYSRQKFQNVERELFTLWKPEHESIISEVALNVECKWETLQLHCLVPENARKYENILA